MKHEIKVDTGLHYKPAPTIKEFPSLEETGIKYQPIEREEGGIAPERAGNLLSFFFEDIQKYNKGLVIAYYLSAVALVAYFPILFIGFIKWATGNSDLYNDIRMFVGMGIWGFSMIVQKLWDKWERKTGGL